MMATWRGSLLGGSAAAGWETAWASATDTVM